MSRRTPLRERLRAITPYLLALALAIAVGVALASVGKAATVSGVGAILPL